MTAPAMLFALLLASLLAGLYHLVLGRRLGQLPLFWLASLGGFALGQALAPLLPLGLPRVGAIEVAAGAAASLVLMSVVRAARL
jgi:hypothetical protein